jgi:hypothetical protein
MDRAKSAMRTLTLQFASLAGHTVRIANVLPGLAGAAMVSWGAAMIYTPVGWMLGGTSLLYFGYEENLRRGRARAHASAVASARQVP